MRAPLFGLAEALHRAYAAHRAGNLMEAERAYKLILRAVPNQFDALHLLGVLEAQRANNEQANRLLGRAINVNPRSVDALNNRANVLRALKRYDEALASCDRALAVKPDFAEALNNRGSVLHDLRRFTEALQSYDKALTIKPDYANALANKSDVLRDLGRHDEALANCERAIALAPDIPEALNVHGAILYALGRYEEALGAYARALAVKPQYSRAWINRGGALEALSRWNAAAESYGRACAIDPKCAEAVYRRGKMLLLLACPDQAIQCFEQALALEPDCAEAHHDYGHALHSLGRVVEANKHYQAALALDPALRGDPIASHERAAYSGEAVPGRAGDAYLRRFFDGFAPTFDACLAQLRYSVPQVLITAMAREMGAPAASWTVLDAGCGTGLCGPLVRPFAEHLAGVDLSEGMIARARERNLYDELVVSELTAFLAARRDAYDLILAADTLIYFGDLAELMAAAAHAVRFGGAFAFSVERLESKADAVGTRGYRLLSHGRYCHTEDYVLATMARAGLRIATLEDASPRLEHGKPVPGFVAVARK